MPTRAAATTGNGRTADQRPRAPRSRAQATAAGSARRLGSVTADHAMPDPAGRCRLETLEAQLVATGRGDVAAFADLYDGLAPRVYGLVLHLIKDVHQSEEVTQQVFLELWQTSARFDPSRGSAYAWVMTRAHHRAVDRIRTTEAWRRRDTADAARSRGVPFDVTAAAAHASLEAQTVRAALAILCPAQRQALDLAYFGGYTYNEVAQLLEIPLGTAKSRIRDGLTRLRGLLAAAQGIEQSQQGQGGCW
jgi:RNA polymerase sigma-70 factor, ECF subfamily